MYSLRLLALVSCLLLSCNNNNLIDNKLEESITLNDYIETIKNTNDSQRIITTIDSLYHSIDTKNILDSFCFVKAKFIYRYHFLNNKSEASNLADSLILISRHAASRATEAYYLKASVLYWAEYYNDAFRYYSIARQLANSNNDTDVLFNIHYLSGMSLYKQNRFKQSIESFTKAIEYYKSDTVTKSIRKQECLNNIGLCYAELELNDSALTYHTMALNFCFSLLENNLAKKNDLVEAIGLSYRNIGNIYKNTYLYDSAIYYYNKCINEIVNCNNRTYKTAILSLSQCYYKIGKYKVADSIFSQYSHNVIDSLDVDLSELYYSSRIAKDTQSGNYKFAFNNSQKNNELNKYRTKNVIQAIQSDFNSGLQKSEDEQLLNLLNQEVENKNLMIQNNMILIVSLAILTIFLLTFLFILNKKNIHNRKLLIKISEQKLELEERYTNLEIKDNNKSKLLRSIAHDIINPLTTISATVQLEIMKNKSLLNIETVKSLNKIKDISDNIAEMSKELVKKAKGDNSFLLKESVNLVEIIKESIQDVNDLAERKKQHILFNSNVQSVPVNVDKTKVERVFINLLSNAIKFSYLESEIIINLIVYKDNIVVSFQDFGIGIPNELENEIFKEFGKAGRVGTNNEPSNHIGLSIAKEIVIAHGGRTWFKSIENSGTTFYISLPVN